MDETNAKWVEDWKQVCKQREKEAFLPVYSFQENNYP